MKNLIIIILILVNTSVIGQIDTIKCDVARNLNYMSIEDKDMIMEINILRTNPKSFIPHIENHINKQEKVLKLAMSAKSNATVQTIKFIKIEIEAAKELIRELDTITPMGILTPVESMHIITKEHAEYVKSVNKCVHNGPNGEDLNTRMEKMKVTTLSENVGHGNDVISAMVSLLVDANIPHRGHRRNLLNKNHKFISVAISGGFAVQNFTK